MKLFFCKNRIFFIPKRYFFIPSKIVSYPQKNENFFHTLIQKFHTLKKNFIPLYKSFIPCQNIFHTLKNQFHTLTFKFLFSYLKNFFIPLYKNFIPCKKNFIPLNFYFHTFVDLFHTLGTFFIPCENLFCFMLCFHFIPNTSISYPDHGISYQVAKFSYPQQPISYSFHFPLISLPDSLYVHIHLQLKELVMFADASYDQISLLSLHPVPRDGCDRHRLHPHARYRTHFHRVVKHDHV